MYSCAVYMTCHVSKKIFLKIYIPFQVARQDGHTFSVPGKQKQENQEFKVISATWEVREHPGVVA